MTNDLDLHDLQPIPDAPALFERETGQSYLGRLVAYYGYSFLTGFCRDFGLDQRGIQWGREAALRHLAALTGADPEELVRWTPVRLHAYRHRLGIVEFASKKGPRSHVWQCPQCARDSIAANPGLPAELCLYGRAEWATGFLTVCPEHNVKLVMRTGVPCVVERSDSAYVRAGIFEDLAFIQNEPACPTGFEKHAMAVMLGNTTKRSTYLDYLEVESVAMVSRALGIDIATRNDIAKPGERELMTLGFDAISSGSEGLSRLLAGMRSTLPARFKAQHIVANLLGCISRSKRPDLVCFKHDLVRLLFATFPARPGSKLLHIRCSERSVHSFTSARLEYGVPRQLLLAFARGIPDLAARLAEKPTDILIDKAAADAFFLGQTPFMSSGQLRGYLGRMPGDSTGYLDMLTEAGVISGPLQYPALAGLEPLYSLPVIEQEIQRFTDPFEKVGQPPADLIPLRIAVARTKISLVGLLTLLVRRKLARVAVLDGVPVMDSLLVDRDEILRVLTGDPAPMTFKDAAHYLGVTTFSLDALIAGGWMPSMKPGIDGIKCNLGRLLSTSKLKEFSSRYARVGDTCALTGAKSVRSLRAIGLEPAIFIDLHLKDQARVVWYDRREITKVMKRVDA